MTTAARAQTPPQTIGLTLSGGGFRATLFHLGVISALREIEISPGVPLLSRVTELCAVSGGSVLAAYLAWKWDDFLATDGRYETACDRVIAVTQRDVRNRVLRRIGLRHILVLPWLFRSWRSAALLEREYAAALFGKASFLDLPPDSPFLSILATSLTTGQIVAFESDGVRFGPVHRKQTPFADVRELPLARAVAASAAFPPLSGPLLLSRDNLGFNATDGPDHELTDGGVYDNLGACWLAFASSKRSAGPLDLLLLSDAGIPFDWADRDNFRSRRGYLRRNARANDILMSRLAEYDWKWVKRMAHASREFRIGKRYSAGPGRLSRDQQKRASRIRTDLNFFRDDEVRLLVQHGYLAAIDKLTRRPI